MLHSIVCPGEWNLPRHGTCDNIKETASAIQDGMNRLLISSCPGNGNCSDHGIVTQQECALATQDGMELIVSNSSLSGMGHAVVMGNVTTSLTNAIVTAGWTETDCSIHLCSGTEACHGHGKCDNITGKCNCTAGWTETDCSIHLCSGTEACHGHGKCDNITGKCNCTASWSGVDCSIPPPCPGNGNCSGHGHCLEGNAPAIAWVGSGCNVSSDPYYLVEFLLSLSKIDQLIFGFSILNHFFNRHWSRHNKVQSN